MHCLHANTTCRCCWLENRQPAHCLFNPINSDGVDSLRPDENLVLELVRLSRPLKSAPFRVFKVLRTNCDGVNRCCLREQRNRMVVKCDCVFADRRGKSVTKGVARFSVLADAFRQVVECYETINGQHEVVCYCSKFGNEFHSVTFLGVESFACCLAAITCRGSSFVSTSGE